MACHSNKTIKFVTHNDVRHSSSTTYGSYYEWEVVARVLLNIKYSRIHARKLHGRRYYDVFDSDNYRCAMIFFGQTKRESEEKWKEQHWKSMWFVWLAVSWKLKGGSESTIHAHALRPLNNLAIVFLRRQPSNDGEAAKTKHTDSKQDRAHCERST